MVSKTRAILLFKTPKTQKQRPPWFCFAVKYTSIHSKVTPRKIRSLLLLRCSNCTKVTSAIFDWVTMLPHLAGSSSVVCLFPVEWSDPPGNLNFYDNNVVFLLLSFHIHNCNVHNPFSVGVQSPFLLLFFPCPNDNWCYLVRVRRVYNRDCQTKDGCAP